MGDGDRISASRLALGAMLVSAVLFGAVCSVNGSGLSGSPDGGAGGRVSGGSGGHGGTIGSGGNGSGGNATGGHGAGGVIGTGGTGGTNNTGGTVGSGGTNGTGGTGTGGTNATGGTNGTGGTTATGGTNGTGGTGTGGTNATGGTNGTGGTTATGGTGGTTATGGTIGTGGMTGAGGAAGAGGMGGTAGAGGHAGGGGTGGTRPPSCSSFPSGSSMMLTDGHLHCYWAHGNQLDWPSAEAFCENEGGKLVTILSSMENMSVLHLATQAGLFANINNTVFIGASDGKTSTDRTGAGTFSWVTGETWSYDNWHSGQPDGACTGCGFGTAGCSCAHWAALASDGSWYDRPETPGRAYICEAIAP